MAEIALGLFIRAAMLMTILVILTASAWAALKKLGLMRLDRPFDAADLRTWPLAFATLDAMIYGAIFALIQTTLSNSPLAIAVAAASATLVAMRAVPALASRYRS
jgi:hypothetical protein